MPASRISRPTTRPSTRKRTRLLFELMILVKMHMDERHARGKPCNGACEFGGATPAVQNIGPILQKRRSQVEYTFSDCRWSGTKQVPINFVTESNTEPGTFCRAARYVVGG